MFAKVFRQIFESSIADDYNVRHIFMDLLVLADMDGVVDKTREAIARITNVPLEKIEEAIEKLESPDPHSRNEGEEGRRLVRLDTHRDWGWQIVNYEAYRKMRDEEARRAYFRERKREQRAKLRGVMDSHTLSNNVQRGLGQSNLSTKEEEEEEEEEEKKSREERGTGEGTSEFCLSADAGSNHAVPKKKRAGPIMMSNALIKELASNPAYKEVDVVKEAWKFKTWCETKQKPQTKARFVNWLNRVA